MSDDWGDLENISKPKSQVPKLLFCGCGCLIPVLLLAFVLLSGMGIMSRGQDTELQLQELEDVLPYENVPEGFKLKFGYQPTWWLAILFDAEVYVFMEEGTREEPDSDHDAVPEEDPEEGPEDAPEGDLGEETGIEPLEAEAVHSPQRVWILMRSADEDLGEMLDTSQDEISPWSPPGSEAVETLRVQGRDLPVAVVRGSPPRMPWGAPSESSRASDSLLAIRISSEGEEKTLILLIMGEVAEGVTPEQVTRFLKPFHVGPER